MNRPPEESSREVDFPQTNDKSPSGRRRRRIALHRWTLTWWTVVLVCVAVVIGSGIGLANTNENRTVPVVVLTAAALLAAVTALAVTVARAKVGSDLDEEDLDDHPPQDD